MLKLLAFALGFNAIFIILAVFSVFIARKSSYWWLLFFTGVIINLVALFGWMKSLSSSLLTSAYTALDGNQRLYCWLMFLVLLAIFIVIILLVRKKANYKSDKLDVRKLVGLSLFTAIVFVLQFIGASIRFGTFSISLVLMPIVVGAALFGVGAGAWLGFVFGAVVLFSGDANTFLAIDYLGTIITVLLKGVLAGAAAGLVYHLFSGKVTNGRLALAIVSAFLLLSGAVSLVLGIKHNNGTLTEDIMAAVRSADSQTAHPGTALIVIGAILLAAGLALLLYNLIKKPQLNVSAAVFISAAIAPIVNTSVFLLGCRLFFFDTIKEWAGGTNVGTFMIVGLVGLNFIIELVVNLILSPAIVTIIKFGEKSFSKKR